MSRHQALTERMSSSHAKELVEADIRAELSAHLEHSIAEAVEAGATLEEARRQAQEAFGDLETTVRACARQKLGAQIMLGRIHLLATLSLLIGVLFLAFQSHANSTKAENYAKLASEHAARAKELAAPRVREIIGAAQAVPAEFTVQLGDRIQLVPTYNMDLAIVVPVETDGTILLPVVGHKFVAGMTRAEVEALLAEWYAPYYQHLLIHIRILRD